MDNLNALHYGLEFVEASSAEELRDLLKSITLPTKIVSIYPQGNKHIAWILTQAKIKKVRKDNGKRS